MRIFQRKIGIDAQDPFTDASRFSIVSCDGVGCGKLDFLVAEAGEAVGVMRTIKQALDPQNIMNPGKIVRL